MDVRVSGGRAPQRVKFGLENMLVPTARLELAQLSPLPPQDSVSTNFTTSAVFDFRARARSCASPETASNSTGKYRLPRGRPCWRHGGRRTGRSSPRSRGNLPDRGGRKLRWRAGSRGGSAGPFEHAATAAAHRVVTVTEVGQRQGANEEDSGANRCRARQEIRAARGTEQAARGSAAERGANVGALALLDKHQTDHGYCSDELDRQHEVQPDLHDDVVLKN